MRMRRPVNDPRRPSSPGMIRPPPPPGWESRRPRTPPGLRLPPPPFHEPQSERMADWERHAGRFRPRGIIFLAILRLFCSRRSGEKLIYCIFVNYG